MISSDEALKIILETTNQRTVKELRLKDSLNYTLAQDILSRREQPPFNRAAMDGIAIDSSTPQTSYKIEGTQAAGEKERKLSSRENCVEIMTGSITPQSCDCIIPYENIEIKDAIAYVQSEDIIKNKNIHQKGSDYPAGHQVLKSGTFINSPISAIIASQGKSKIEVYSKPQVIIISTGSELIDLDMPIEEHQIYMSNSYAIKQELLAYGLDDVKTLHIIDGPKETEQAISNCLSNNDIIILTGGVSMGKFDFIPQSLKNLGVKKHFHKIKQKPGKPMWYGTKDNKQIFALPGNPVSCLFCLRKYVIPSLNHAQGIAQQKIVGRLSSEVKFKKDFTYFCPVKASYSPDGTLVLEPIKGNGSGDFYSLAQSDGIAQLEAQLHLFPVGHPCQYFPWSK